MHPNWDISTWLGQAGGCVEGVLEGVWERHDVGRFFFRFDLSDFFGQNGPFN